MLVQIRGQFTYRLKTNLKIQEWHYYLEYISNTSIIQTSKLGDGIDLEKAVYLNKSHFSHFRLKNKNFDNKRAIIDKIIENNLECKRVFCKTYIKSKKRQIVKLKKMTSII